MAGAVDRSGREEGGWGICFRIGVVNRHLPALARAWALGASDLVKQARERAIVPLRMGLPGTRGKHLKHVERVLAGRSTTVPVEKRRCRGCAELCCDALQHSTEQYVTGQ